MADRSYSAWRTTAQPAKATPFAGGNGTDVRKTAVGQFFQ
jgi:hypothetical protein